MPPLLVLSLLFGCANEAEGVRFALCDEMADGRRSLRALGATHDLVIGDGWEEAARAKAARRVASEPDATVRNERCEDDVRAVGEQARRLVDALETADRVVRTGLQEDQTIFQLRQVRQTLDISLQKAAGCRGDLEPSYEGLAGALSEIDSALYAQGLACERDGWKDGG